MTVSHNTSTSAMPRCADGPCGIAAEITETDLGNVVGKHRLLGAIETRSGGCREIRDDPRQRQPGRVAVGRKRHPKVIQPAARTPGEHAGKGKAVGSALEVQRLV